MRVVGLSPLHHNASIALLEEGEIRSAIENDKMTRVRTPGFPDAALEFCLDSAGLKWDELDFVAVASQSEMGAVAQALRASRRSTIRWASIANNNLVDCGWVNQTNNLEISHQRRTAGPSVIYFDHHLCHAASAFYPSPFDRALIITADEVGDGISLMVAVGEGTRIRSVERFAFPHSLGKAYSLVTNLLGFRPHRDEHKTQWLSLAGEPVFKKLFVDILSREPGHVPYLDHSYFLYEGAGDCVFSPKFYESAGIENDPEKLREEVRTALASSIQSACSEILIDLAQYFQHAMGAEYLCLAGGLFENSLLVSSIEKSLGLNRVYVPPGPGNAGTSVGAALLTWYGTSPNKRSTPLNQVYWGPNFASEEVKYTLDNCKTTYSYVESDKNRIEDTVRRLVAGEIVAWFHGAAEFGARSLGNRSVLASPWAPYVKENINNFIKHREWFRPFAISVPQEDCDKYFTYSDLCSLMNSLAWIRPECKSLLEGFELPGGIIRLHVVKKEHNPLYWDLLKRFGQEASAPILLNTSFSLFDEPMVIQPRDAVRSYFGSGIDALVMDRFVLAKN